VISVDVSTGWCLPPMNCAFSVSFQWHLCAVSSNVKHVFHGYQTKLQLITSVPTHSSTLMDCSHAPRFWASGCRCLAINKAPRSGFPPRMIAKLVYSSVNYLHNISTKSLFMNQHWLVVWNMAFIVPYIGNVIIRTDEVIFFRGVGIPPTRFLLTIINHI